MLAPAAVTKLLRPVVAILRCPTLVDLPLAWLLRVLPDGIPASLYLDDLLVLVRKLQAGILVLEVVKELYDQLGLTAKISKSVLTTHWFIKQLGVLIDCECHFVLVPPEKMVRAIELSASLLKGV